MPMNPFYGFPANYQPVQYQPAQYQPMQYQQQQPQMQQAQTMTLPTIHAEIVQVENEQAAASYPVGAGASQMMMARDDSAIYVKTATANGFTLDVFEKRVKSPQNAIFDPAEYVRKDEIETLVTAALTAQGAYKHGKREDDAE